MKTKNFLTFAFALCMAVALTACGEKEATETNVTEEEVATETNVTEEEVATETNVTEEEVMTEEKVIDTECIIASGECGDQGDNVTWVLDGNWTLTISGTGKMTDYDSADSVPWREYVKTPSKEGGISDIIIKDGVTYLGNNAFNGVKNYSEENKSICTIDIANSVTEIGICTFGTWNQETFTIPDSVTKIGEYAFYDSELTNIIIPDSVTELGAYAFSHCKNLTEVTLSNSLKELHLGAFSYCYELTKLVIPENVEKITGGFGYEGCGLEEIYVSDNLTYIFDDDEQPLGLFDVLIHTPAGSLMEQYAIEHNLTYDNNY